MAQIKIRQVEPFYKFRSPKQPFQHYSGQQAAQLEGHDFLGSSDMLRYQ